MIFCLNVQRKQKQLFDLNSVIHFLKIIVFIVTSTLHRINSECTINKDLSDIHCIRLKHCVSLRVTFSRLTRNTFRQFYQVQKWERGLTETAFLYPKIRDRRRCENSTRPSSSVGELQQDGKAIVGMLPHRIIY